MDTSEYLPMFLAECRENLQELNLAVVGYEENPDDPEIVVSIFRIAHSMKGMAATMGFEQMARLTHKMEDVFELLRQRGSGMSKEAVDVVLACLDALEGAVDSIEASGGEQLDPEPLIERLAALVRSEDAVAGDKKPAEPAEAPAAEAPASAEDGGASSAGEPTADAPAEPASAEQPATAHPASEQTAASEDDAAPTADGDRRTLKVRVVLAEDAQMPSVRAFQVLAALGEHGEVVSSTPGGDEIDGFTGRVIEAEVATDADVGIVGAAARAVSDITDVTVAEPRSEDPKQGEQRKPHLRAIDGPKAKDGGANGGQRPAGRKHATTVRVDAERLDQLMHLMGELVVQRNRVEALAAEADVPGLSRAMQDLTRSSQALQAMVMQIRMIPIEAVFLRFPRLVRDAASKLGKQVDLRLVGQETELDRTVIDAIGDPLVHLIRNSLDHGLEPPDERIAAGKQPTGRLTIAARHAGGSIVITVADDGRGVDPQKVARVAVERGLITPDQAAAVDERAAIELLFQPGFSTAEQVGDLSGRGVGMDAVRARIRELGGEVTMSSTLGQGTETEIRLPLTLAIMSALLVGAGGRPFGIPLQRVERTMRIDEHPVRSVAGRQMLVLDDEALPLVRAVEVLGTEDDDTSVPDTHVVIVRGTERKLALSVQGLMGQRELVTRPLPSSIAHHGAVSGAAQLSDGQIVLLVDCDALTPDSATAVAAPRALSSAA